MLQTEKEICFSMYFLAFMYSRLTIFPFSLYSVIQKCLPMTFTWTDFTVTQYLHERTVSLVLTASPYKSQCLSDIFGIQGHHQKDFQGQAKVAGIPVCPFPPPGQSSI